MVFQKIWILYLALNMIQSSLNNVKLNDWIYKTGEITRYDDHKANTYQDVLKIAAEYWWWNK